jgi:hypothetical protein
MNDFPTVLVDPNFGKVSLTDKSCVVGQAALACNVVATAAVWPSINEAFYMPFQIEVPLIVKKAAVRVSVQSGNLDMGIYAENGKALVTKGSTAVGAAGLQTIDFTTAISLGAASPLLMPGTYYFAMNCDNVTASFFRLGMSVALNRVCGIQKQSVGAIALPATATFAAMDVANVFMWVITGNTVV